MPREGHHKTMRNLLLIALSLSLTACGNCDRSCSRERREREEMRARVANTNWCNRHFYANRCAHTLIRGRELFPEEIYDQACADDYHNCLNTRSVGHE